MAERLFSSSFKKVKDITVQTPKETIGHQPEWYSDRRAVYMDTRGNTSLVMAIPDYIHGMLAGQGGKHVFHRDEQTGTHYIESTRGIDGLENDYQSMTWDYCKQVMDAAAEKVIVIKAAYLAKDTNGLRVNRLPSFSDIYGGALVGFTYGLRWRIKDGLYSRSGNSYHKCGYGDDLVRDAVIIPWSQEAEDTCLKFHQGLIATGQRLHDFLSQDETTLRHKLESGSTQLLGHELPQPAGLINQET